MKLTIVSIILIINQASATPQYYGGANYPGNTGNYGGTNGIDNINGLVGLFNGILSSILNGQRPIISQGGIASQYPGHGGISQGNLNPINGAYPNQNGGSQNGGSQSGGSQNGGGWGSGSQQQNGWNPNGNNNNGGLVPGQANRPGQAIRPGGWNPAGQNALNPSSNGINGQQQQQNGLNGAGIDNGFGGTLASSGNAGGFGVGSQSDSKTGSNTANNSLGSTQGNNNESTANGMNSQGSNGIDRPPSSALSGLGNASGLQSGDISANKNDATADQDE